MRSFQSRNWACDRARQAVSVSLDSELSQLERVLLESHLDRCPACAEFAADAAAMTLELRTAPLVRLDRPVELPMRSRIGYGVRRTGARLAAASVAATAVLRERFAKLRTFGRRRFMFRAAGPDLAELRETNA